MFFSILILCFIGFSLKKREFCDASDCIRSTVVLKKNVKTGKNIFK